MGQIISSRCPAVEISKVERVFKIVSHVGGRYESNDQFTGNQPLKNVIHAETVLPEAIDMVLMSDLR